MVVLPWLTFPHDYFKPYVSNRIHQVCTSLPNIIGSILNRVITLLIRHSVVSMPSDLLDSTAIVVILRWRMGIRLIRKNLFCHFFWVTYLKFGPCLVSLAWIKLRWSGLIGYLQIIV